MRTAERIKGRVVEIEVGEAAGFGWVAAGLVLEGFPHEKGILFEAKAQDPIEAETQLRAEIEAFFA